MDIYNTKPRKIKCVRNDDDVWVVEVKIITYWK